MPSPSDRVSTGIMFSGCLSAAFVRLSGCSFIRLGRSY